MLTNRFHRAAVCACLLASVLALPRGHAAEPSGYTAQATYRKLVGQYPFIQVAGSQLPTGVEAKKNLTYVKYGERRLQLDLYLPRTAVQAPRPAIIFVHGGGWREGTRENFAPMAIRLAEQGYVTATISYRLSGEAKFPAAIQDAKAAVRWLRSRAGEFSVDPGRIALAGGSAGGQIASLAGVTDGLAQFAPADGRDAVSSAVQAIINIDGLSDFTAEEARKFEDDPARAATSAGAWLGGRYAEIPATWRAASPLFYVGKTTPPILFIVSAQPRFSVGKEAMQQKLQQLGIACEIVRLPQTPHSFWLFDPWLTPTVDATRTFLDREFQLPPR